MLKHIESQADYDEYKSRVAAFFERENIQLLSDSGKESFFSHESCECCSRPLGGDRYTMNGLTYPEPYGAETFEYNVCVDCLYYNEYNQLDDMTMIDYDLE